MYSNRVANEHSHISPYSAEQRITNYHDDDIMCSVPAFNLTAFFAVLPFCYDRRRAAMAGDFLLFNVVPFCDCNGSQNLFVSYPKCPFLCILDYVGSQVTQ